MPKIDLMPGRNRSPEILPDRGWFRPARRLRDCCRSPDRRPALGKPATNPEPSRLGIRASRLA